MTVIETFKLAIEKFTSNRSELTIRRDALQMEIDRLDSSIKQHHQAIGRVVCEPIDAPVTVS
jgi:hypothetical protein